MTEWDGRGLPPAAQARVDRASTDGVRSSLLSIRGQAGVQSVGLDPVGEVMGCIVQQIGWSGWGGCGVYYGGGFGGYAMAAPTVTSGGGRGYGGFAPYVDALYRGFDTAMYRMLLEAHALGADGVVGVSWSQERLLDQRGAQEFMVRGTAVRARSQRAAGAHLLDRSLRRRRREAHARRLGADRAGVGDLGSDPPRRLRDSRGGSLVVHPEHRDSRATPSWSRSPGPMPARQFEERAGRSRSDAATVSSMSLHVREIEPGEGHRDHIAEAMVVGNSLVKFHKGATAPTDSRVVLPLRRSSL